MRNQGAAFDRSCYALRVTDAFPMGLYDRYILPWVLDHVMLSEPLAAQRRDVLAQVEGEVLEIGFGSGLNLPFYPPNVRRLTAVEPNAGMSRRARERVAA